VRAALAACCVLRVRAASSLLYVLRAAMLRASACYVLQCCGAAVLRAAGAFACIACCVLRRCVLHAACVVRRHKLTSLRCYRAACYTCRCWTTDCWTTGLLDWTTGPWALDYDLGLDPGLQIPGLRGVRAWLLDYWTTGFLDFLGWTTDFLDYRLQTTEPWSYTRLQATGLGYRLEPGPA
jgi:hypothetical protein